MSRIGRTLLIVALTVVALVSAAGVWFAGSGSALAPEPARLNSTLYSGSVSGVYVNTLTQTNIVFLSSSWTPSSYPAGKPCVTTAPIPAGTVTSHVVVASGNYRKCY
jgi:hypothetical protein